MENDLIIKKDTISLVYLLDKGCMTLKNTNKYAEILEIINKIINDINFMLELQKNTIPIRPDRNFVRNMSLKRNKYSQNTKRCL